MIGDTLSVTYDGVANTLVKINQDNYSSEYRIRTAAYQLDVRIRNSYESAKAGARPFERHHVELIRTEFDLVNGDRIFTASTVIRLMKGADPDVAEKTALALCGTLSAALVDKVVGWQS